MARYAADPAAAVELAETALGICLRHVADPSSVDLTDDEQDRLYGLLLAMLATDDARDADPAYGADIRARLQRAPAPRPRASRKSFLACFNSTAAAVEFENQALSVGEEFLPVPARRVLDGGKATPEYWAWLIDQIPAE
jgi:hypothetical protein